MSAILELTPTPPDSDLPAGGMLEGLNERQRAAVLATQGPVLVLAGAGSGKTKVLVTRIAYLIRYSGVLPGQVLGITFTRKAAQEMRHRLSSLLTQEEAGGVALSTFHALGVALLRESGAAIGVSPKVGILDESDGATRVRQLLKSMGIRRDAEGETPREVLQRLSAAKAMLASHFAEEVRRGVQGGAELVARFRAGERDFWRERNEQLGAPDPERFAQMYARYQARLLEDKVVDYCDLICLPLLLFLQRPDIAEIYRRRWTHLTVDEYQDTDFVQDHLLRILAGGEQNLCVVGDDDQAIYSWRGARVENIRTFPERYPGAARITLDQNYRSQPLILEAANAVLSARAERGRLPKRLWTQRTEGTRLRLWSTFSEQAEAAAVAQDILAAQEKGEIRSLDEVLVLYRMNSLSRSLEDAFRAARIPYRIVNGLALHERKEVRDLLAYLRLADNWFDLLSFERAVASPSRGVGPSTIEALAGYARAGGVSPVEAALESGQIPGIRPKAARALRRFAELVIELHGIGEQAGAAQALQYVLEETGYRQSLIRALAEAEKEDDVEEAERRANCLEDVDEFVLYVEEFSRLRALQAVAREGRVGSAANLTALLDELAAFAPREELPEVVRTEEGDEQLQGGVTMMSVHSAKGLEAERVYVVGLEEKVFPAYAREAGGEESRIAEEARLFYVAITRAREHLVLSSSLTRELKRGEASPMARSRFLAALPETIYLHQRKQ